MPPASTILAEASTHPPHGPSCEHQLELWQPDPENPRVVFGYCTECARLHTVRARPPTGATESEPWEILAVLSDGLNAAS